MTVPKKIDTSKLKNALTTNKDAIILGYSIDDETFCEPMASGVVNTRREQDWYIEHDPLIITDHEWKLAKAKTENDKKRACFNCSKGLNYQEYIIANPNVEILKLKEYWESKKVGILCCSCKWMLEMLKGYKRDNPKLFELL